MHLAHVCLNSKKLFSSEICHAQVGQVSAGVATMNVSAGASSITSPLSATIRKNRLQSKRVAIAAEPTDKHVEVKDFPKTAPERALIGTCLLLHDGKSVKQN